MNKTGSEIAIGLQKKFSEIVQRAFAGPLNWEWVMGALQKVIEGDIPGLGCPYATSMTLSGILPQSFDHLRDEWLSRNSTISHYDSATLIKMLKPIYPKDPKNIEADLVFVNLPNALNTDGHRTREDLIEIRKWALKKELRPLTFEESLLFIFRNQKYTPRFLVLVEELLYYWHIVYLAPGFSRVSLVGVEVAGGPSITEGFKFVFAKGKPLDINS